MAGFANAAPAMAAAGDNSSRRHVLMFLASVHRDGGPGTYPSAMDTGIRDHRVGDRPELSGLTVDRNA